MTLPRTWLAAAMLLASVGCSSTGADVVGSPTASEPGTPPAEALTGAWILTDLSVPSASPSLTEASPPTLRITEVVSGEATFVGRGTCDAYEGRASVDGDSFEPLPDGGLSFTGKVCEDEDFEQAYFHVVRNATSWSVNDGRLTLSSEHEQSSATFTADPTPLSELPSPPAFPR